MISRNKIAINIIAPTSKSMKKLIDIFGITKSLGARHSTKKKT